MFALSRISKYLIAVSLSLALLVIWLGSRYWTDARTQFTGATQLELSVAPETTLFKIASALDRERHAVQTTLVDAARFEADLDHLRSLTRDTKQLFEQLRREIASLQTPHWTDNRYSEDTTASLMTELEDKFKRTAMARSVITGQLYLPIDERSDSVRMQLFDAYGNFIKALNNLRQHVHAYPEKNYRGVLSAHKIKDAIWSLKEAIARTTSLVQSLNLKHRNGTIDTLNVDNLTLRLLQNHERTDQAINDLAQMLKSEEIVGVDAKDIATLESQYRKIYYSLVKQVILVSPQFVKIGDRLSQWMRSADEIRDDVQQIERVALTNTLSAAASVKRDTAVSLAANTLLVLLCMVMACATLRIAWKIQRQSDRDELTGIPNRRYFNTAITALLKRTDLSKHEKLVLMTMDLNGFKSINDTMGHVAGDNLLKQVAQRLNAIVSDKMVLARMGGDEFSLLYTTTNPTDAFQLACRVRDTFIRSFSVDGGLIKMSTSIGYSIYPDDAQSGRELQITSDFAMFSAKQSGGQTIQPFDSEVASQYRNRLLIEKDLVRAINHNQLELHYQPQVNLTLGCVGSVEALIRWNHPERGNIPPSEFIVVAEEAGLMPMLGTWVLNEACRQAALWQNTVMAPVRIAINVSIHQVMQNDFVQQVVDVTAQHGVPSDSLELEITESVVMADINWIAKCLSELKALGFRIALDDFGTGHSSLSQLQNLPLDTLKIDRSFISKLDDDSRNMKSVTATIASIAEIYGLETVAEGIETDRQLFEVNQLGIDIAQGYFYSKPLPVDKLPDAIAAISNLMSNGRKAA
jgi:diguanylate cyclase (GGDEF)-like protein